MDFQISRCSNKTKSITQFLKNETDCVWIVNKQLSAGAQGQIFKVCCGSNDLECRYVMKTAQNNGENEIKMHTLFYKLGLAPKIVEAFICNEEIGKSRTGLPLFNYETVIVMEKKDFNAKDYIFHLQKTGSSQKFIIEMIEEVMYQTILAISKANSNRLWHNDKIIENIMLDINPDGTFKDLVFIDFSFSSVTETPEDAKLEESYSEILMTFRLLLKNYLTKIDEMDKLEEIWKSIKDNVYERLGVKDIVDVKLGKAVLKKEDYNFSDLDITNKMVGEVEDVEEMETPSGMLSFDDDDEEEFRPSSGQISFDDDDGYSSPVGTPPSSPKKRLFSTPPPAPKRSKHRYGPKKFKIEEIFY